MPPVSSIVKIRLQMPWDFKRLQIFDILAA
jgi:hypothetical protein